MRVLIVTILMGLGLIGCTTTEETSKSAAKKVVACYCGTIKSDKAAQPVCAVWQKSWKKKQQQFAIATSEKEDCGIDECKNLGDDDNPCTTYEEYPRPPARTVAAPCYCDTVSIYGNSLGDKACAIWRPGDTELLEYHFTADCELETCKMAPFVFSNSYCNDQFQRYYPE